MTGGWRASGNSLVFAWAVFGVVLGCLGEDLGLFPGLWGHFEEQSACHFGSSLKRQVGGVLRTIILGLHTRFARSERLVGFWGIVQFFFNFDVKGRGDMMKGPLWGPCPLWFG